MYKPTNDLSVSSKPVQYGMKFKICTGGSNWKQLFAINPGKIVWTLLDVFPDTTKVWHVCGAIDLNPDRKHGDEGVGLFVDVPWFRTKFDSDCANKVDDTLVSPPVTDPITLMNHLIKMSQAGDGRVNAQFCLDWLCQKQEAFESSTDIGKVDNVEVDIELKTPEPPPKTPEPLLKTPEAPANSISDINPPTNDHGTTPPLVLPADITPPSTNDHGTTLNLPQQHRHFKSRNLHHVRVCHPLGKYIRDVGLSDMVLKKDEYCLTLRLLECDFVTKPVYMDSNFMRIHVYLQQLKSMNHVNTRSMSIELTNQGIHHQFTSMLDDWLNSQFVNIKDEINGLGSAKQRSFSWQCLKQLKVCDGKHQKRKPVDMKNKAMQMLDILAMCELLNVTHIDITPADFRSVHRNRVFVPKKLMRDSVIDFNNVENENVQCIDLMEHLCNLKNIDNAKLSFWYLRSLENIGNQDWKLEFVRNYLNKLSANIQVHTICELWNAEWYRMLEICDNTTIGAPMSYLLEPMLSAAIRSMIGLDLDEWHKHQGHLIWRLSCDDFNQYFGKYSWQHYGGMVVTKAVGTTDCQVLLSALKMGMVKNGITADKLMLFNIVGGDLCADLLQVEQRLIKKLNIKRLLNCQQVFVRWRGFHNPTKYLDQWMTQDLQRDSDTGGLIIHVAINEWCAIHGSETFPMEALNQTSVMVSVKTQIGDAVIHKQGKVHGFGGIIGNVSDCFFRGEFVMCVVTANSQSSSHGFIQNNLTRFPASTTAIDTTNGFKCNVNVFDFLNNLMPAVPVYKASYAVSNLHAVVDYSSCRDTVGAFNGTTSKDEDWHAYMQQLGNGGYIQWNVRAGDEMNVVLQEMINWWEEHYNLLFGQSNMIKHRLKLKKLNYTQWLKSDARVTFIAVHKDAWAAIAVRDFFGGAYAPPQLNTVNNETKSCLFCLITPKMLVQMDSQMVNEFDFWILEPDGDKANGLDCVQTLLSRIVQSGTCNNGQRLFNDQQLINEDRCDDYIKKLSDIAQSQCLNQWISEAVKFLREVDLQHTKISVRCIIDAVIIILRFGLIAGAKMLLEALPPKFDKLPKVQWLIKHITEFTSWSPLTITDINGVQREIEIEGFVGSIVSKPSTLHSVARCNYDIMEFNTLQAQFVKCFDTVGNANSLAAFKVRNLDNTWLLSTGEFVKAVVNFVGDTKGLLYVSRNESWMMIGPLHKRMMVKCNASLPLTKNININNFLENECGYSKDGDVSEMHDHVRYLLLSYPPSTTRHNGDFGFGNFAVRVLSYLDVNKRQKSPLRSYALSLYRDFVDSTNCSFMASENVLNIHSKCFNGITEGSVDYIWTFQFLDESSGSQLDVDCHWWHKNLQVFKYSGATHDRCCAILCHPPQSMFDKWYAYKHNNQNCVLLFEQDYFGDYKGDSFLGNFTLNQFKEFTSSCDISVTVNETDSILPSQPNDNVSKTCQFDFNLDDLKWNESQIDHCIGKVQALMYTQSGRYIFFMNHLNAEKLSRLCTYNFCWECDSSYIIGRIYPNKDVCDLFEFTSCNTKDNQKFKIIQKYMKHLTVGEVYSLPCDTILGHFGQWPVKVSLFWIVGYVYCSALSGVHSVKDLNTKSVFNSFDILLKQENPVSCISGAFCQWC